MPSEVFNDFFAGCLGGVAGVLSGHPLDTVKVRLQTQSAQQPLYRGTLHCFQRIVHTEGPTSLYKGMSSPLASLALINAVIFGVHGQVSKQFSSEQQQSLCVHFVAGASAGAAQELLKLRVQVLSPNCPSHPSTSSAQSPLVVARQILREKGVRHFGRGLLATQARDCPAMGVYFSSYTWLTRKLSPQGDGEGLCGWQLLCAGGAAGMLSWLCNYPADVVKTRFQAEDSHANYAEVIRRAYAERGWRTFFVGLGSTLIRQAGLFIRAFPTNAATFFTVDWTYRVLLRPHPAQLPEEGRTSSARPPSATCHSLLPEAGCTLLEPMII